MLNTRDFGLSLEMEYFDNLQRIADEDDIYERERRIDKLRWEWLEENTVLIILISNTVRVLMQTRNSRTLGFS